MKIQRRLFHIILTLIPFISVQAQIDPQLINKLEDLLSSDYQIYTIDSKATINYYKSIDTYFNSNFLLGYSSEEIDKGLSQGKALDLKKDIKIVNNKVISEKSVNLLVPIPITYKVGKYERQFVKNYRNPVTKELNDTEVISISTNFIKSNKFLVELRNDELKQTHVYARRLDIYDEKDNLTEKSIVLQRAILERKIDGIPVLNSKVIVDVHPLSKEILSFKNLSWAPIDPATAKLQAYKSKDKVIEEIKSAIASRANKITDVAVSYMQMENLLVPVLKIDYTNSAGDTRTQGAEFRSLVIVLPDKLKLNQPDAKTRLPMNPQ